MQNCPCASGVIYESCCEKYHLGTPAPTAEALMRSRYSAFAKHNIQYISKTHVPGTTDFNETDAKQWATDSSWKNLEIIKTYQGQREHDKGVVEFKAYYSDIEGNDFCHHEIADFIKQDGKWYYVDGQIVGTQPIKRAIPKVGRNESCPCGSGKKFKKCCGTHS